MKKLYKTMNEIGRKYALPLIIVGSLSFGSCNKKEYKTENSTIIIKKNHTRLIEKRDSIEIKYKYHVSYEKSKLEYLEIKSGKETYHYVWWRKKDEQIMKKFQERSDSIINYFDSLENIKKKERIEFGLKSLEGKLE